MFCRTARMRMDVRRCVFVRALLGYRNPKIFDRSICTRMAFGPYAVKWFVSLNKFILVSSRLWSECCLPFACGASIRNWWQSPYRIRCKRMAFRCDDDACGSPGRVDICTCCRRSDMFSVIFVPSLRLIFLPYPLRPVSWRLSFAYGPTLNL